MPLRRKLTRLSIIIAGTLGVLVAMVPVVMEINLAIACPEPSPSCLPRYRAAGHFWSKLGVMTRARHWYARGAEAHDPIAMFHLGWTHEQEGWSDVARAGREWKAASALHDFMLGVMAEFTSASWTIGGWRLWKQALQLYVKLHAWSEAELAALRTHFAKLARIEFASAGEWYRRSAALEFAPAMNNLGLLYLDGRGVERDQEQAHRWILAAARAGNPVGAMNVVVLASGAGQKNPDEVGAWSTISPSKANAADLAEPTFERTLLFGPAVPAIRREQIRQAAREKSEVRLGVKPLKPDASLPLFKRVPGR
jgi:TPR repeat protein